MAVTLLEQAEKGLGAPLRRLLQLKTRAGYDARPIGDADARRAKTAATKLVSAAQMP